MTGLAILTLAGCGHHAEENSPASTNSLGEQPMPGATVSNNAAASPAVTWITTNNPVFTNSSDTNIPAATNQ